MKVWSTEAVNKTLTSIHDGVGEVDMGCFRQGDINIRQPNLVFDYTDDEAKELLKCAKDVEYFADKYAHAMTDEGVQKIELRPYQHEMLKTFQKERNVILLASRQVGKCHLYDSKVKIENEHHEERIVSIGAFYFEVLSKIRKLTLLEKIKWKLWKIYDSL